MTTQTHPQLNRDVLTGKSNGKILWQPRIGEWYDARIFAGEPLPERYQGLTLNQIYRELGCSARTYEYMSCIKRKEDSRIRTTTRWLAPLEYEETIETPVGKITQIIRKNTSNSGIYPKKWFVVEEEDLKVDCWLQEHTEWEFDLDRYEKLHREWGDLGISATTTPHISIQRLTHDTMGLENAVYAIYDYPGLVEKNLRAADECQQRLLRMLCESPIEIINFGGHGDSRLLSPAFMEDYLLPVCQSWNETLHAAGKITYSHWDGAVKALLPYIKELGFDAIEAITPMPQGDVTVDEMKAALGDHTFLVDGIAAILFDEAYPLAQLEAQTRDIIEKFAPKLVLGISDEIAYTGNIERIRFVGEIVDEYNRHCTV